MKNVVENTVITVDNFIEEMKSVEPEVLFERDKDVEELDSTEEGEKLFIETVNVLYNIKTLNFDIQFVIPYYVSYNTFKTKGTIEYFSELRLRSELCIKKTSNVTIEGLDLKDNEYYIIMTEGDEESAIFEGQTVNFDLYCDILEKVLNEYKPAFSLTEEQEQECLKEVGIGVEEPDEELEREIEREIEKEEEEEWNE